MTNYLIPEVSEKLIFALCFCRYVYKTTWLRITYLKEHVSVTRIRFRSCNNTNNTERQKYTEEFTA
jgi:hypothetical protein